MSSPEASRVQTVLFGTDFILYFPQTGWALHYVLYIAAALLHIDLVSAGLLLHSGKSAVSSETRFQYHSNLQTSPGIPTMQRI